MMRCTSRKNIFNYAKLFDIFSSEEECIFVCAEKIFLKRTFHKYMVTFIVNMQTSNY